jgi:putative hydrolase of the HAD superfamily
VLFDLDDTLYDEMSFVASGFRAVASYAHVQLGCGETAFFQTCMQLVRDCGRGQVFNVALEQLGINDPVRVTDMVAIYRAHQPGIRLDEDAVSTLHALRARQIKCGVITDGRASVQRNKAKTLGLSELVDFIIYTDELGREFWKPHELSFQMALEKMMMNPAEVAYVGNDENKDFLGANRVGLLTIKVARRQIRCAHTDPSYQAKYTVDKVSDILPIVFAVALTS